MKKNLCSLLLFVFAFQTIALCQTDSTVIKGAVSKLKTLLTDHIIEKAYLQFDRPYPLYVAGESVYFKAYVVKGERHDLSNISGMLHVDLINNKTNSVIESNLVQLNYGLGWGDVKLPDTLQKGSYRIRAYTEWMRNEKEPAFFEQYVSVSSFNNADRIGEANRQGSQPDLQFFPEGGNLVNDLKSKVAFKAIGTNGLGIEVKGVIVDNENKEVVQIASSHLGMGAFDLTPEPGKKYKAKVTFANGTQTTIDLPAAAEKGITLAVNTDDPSKVSVEIKANRAYYKENMNKQLNLLIYWAGAIRTINTKLDNSILGLDLPTTTFRTGVLKISLLSQTGESLGERLSFIQNPDLLNLSVSSDKTSYAKREDVALNINSKNKDGNNVNGFFSLSVVDESKVQVDENASNTILTYLLLTSELKGYIEKPNYYFTNPGKETRANLDALMLTQGYRRFVWKQLLDENLEAIKHNPEQYLDISGTLTSKSGVPLSGAKVILLPLAQTETTDDRGHFKFAKINYESGTQFIVKAPSATGKNAAVLAMDKPSPGPIVSPADPLLAKYNANADILLSYQNGLSAGVVTASTNSARLAMKNDKSYTPKVTDNYRSSNLAGPGHADQVITGQDFSQSPSLSDALNGRLHGITFAQGMAYINGNTVITSSGAVTEPMLLVLDGNVGAISSVNDVNPATVETVEVLRENNATIYGVKGGAGVLVITTRLGGSNSVTASKEMSPGVFAIEPKGFYKAKEFYSPAYDVNPQNASKPDLRTTIYWKPDVNTDIGGNAVVKYFNSDAAGSYLVIVEGIDANGNLGRQVFRYKVQ